MLWQSLLFLNVNNPFIGLFHVMVYLKWGRPVVFSGGACDSKTDPRTPRFKISPQYVFACHSRCPCTVTVARTIVFFSRVRDRWPPHLSVAKNTNRSRPGQEKKRRLRINASNNLIPPAAGTHAKNYAGRSNWFPAAALVDKKQGGRVNNGYFGRTVWYFRKGASVRLLI